MSLSFFYGDNQQFRFRHQDINILGHVDAPGPFQSCGYSLNSGAITPFYVKQSDAGETAGPSVNRLVHQGDFNIEIPVTCADLSAGDNSLEVRVIDNGGVHHVQKMFFRWNPSPVPLPLDLSDLTRYTKIQEVGQIVDGAYDIDRVQNVIRAKSPVGWDMLFLIGSPNGSQEATYNIRFSGTDTGTFLGLSDFFAGHESQDPDDGVKPGYSTAGLATIRPSGAAQCWISWGDLTDRKESWVVKTEPEKKTKIVADMLYSVRHQVVFSGGINYARFRLWPAQEPEPSVWLCEENDSLIGNEFRKFTTGSFGLFQYSGSPTEWSNIKLHEYK